MIKRNQTELDASDSEDQVSELNTSRRQRLFGLAKTARDVYLPKLSDSVSLLATGVSNRAFSTDKYHEDGSIKVPLDASITLVPTYTRLDSKGKYHVDVSGWLACPGLMTRKNRLIFSLVKQIIRYDSHTAIDNLESEKLKQDAFNDTSDTDTIASSDSASVSLVGLEPALSVRTNSSGSGEDLLRERLSYFIARFIANAELSIIIGSEKELETRELAVKDILTDNKGCFNECVVVDYKPSVIQVSAKRNEQIVAFQPVDIVSSKGIAIVSDIDDTVKLTGVVGDKRELLTNLLLKDVALWTIPSVALWYGKLAKSKQVTFHYVSNSPVQLFPTLLKYFKEVGLPHGSMHLKQYTGNIISSLMEPSSSRKRTALTKLATDFPEKKFICIGDSGEWDFESYVNMAQAFPERVLAIYIRYVPGSLSNIDDEKILAELNRIVLHIKRDGNKNNNEPKYTPENLDDLIDLTDTPVQFPTPVSHSPSTPEIRAAKLPPIVPKKPSVLKGNQVSKSPPPLPSRDRLSRAHTDSEMETKLEHPLAPKLPQRPTKTTLDFQNPSRDDILDNLQNIYYSHHFEDLRYIDERGAEWIERVMTGSKALAHTKTTIRFFHDDEDDLYDTSYAVMKDIAEIIQF